MCAFTFYFAYRSRSAFKFVLNLNEFANYEKISKMKTDFYSLTCSGLKPICPRNQPSRPSLFPYPTRSIIGPPHLGESPAPGRTAVPPSSLRCTIEAQPSRGPTRDPWTRQTPPHVRFRDHNRNKFTPFQIQSKIIDLRTNFEIRFKNPDPSRRRFPPK
jgi:hypothetical protein